MGDTVNSHIHRPTMLARPIYATCLGPSQQSALALALAFKSVAAPNCKTAGLSTFRNAAFAATTRRSFALAATTSPARTASSTSSPSSSFFLLLAAGGSALALYNVHRSSPLRCEGVTTSAARPYAEPHTPSIQGPGSAKLSNARTRRNDLPEVESGLDLRSLSFGAVAGISTGVFIKKGLKAAGFLLGGAFVFLQYLATRGMVNVDWRSMASKYESKLESLAGQGTGSRLSRLGNRVLDFLMADFPPRATFAAGLALGLRIG